MDGKGAPGGGPAGGRRVVDTALFKHGFSSDAFLTSLAQHSLLQQETAAERQQPQAVGATAAAQASLAKAKTLLQTLDRADVELVDMHREITAAVGGLQDVVARDEGDFEGGIREVEVGVEGVRDAFKALEARSTKVSQVATRIGDRLQTADNLRGRAVDLIELLGHLQHFSMLPEGETFQRLPPLFWEDESLRQAATTTRKLVKLVTDARSAAQRSRLVASASHDNLLQLLRSGQTAAAVNGPGSLDHTARCLTAYFTHLEGRVLNRFDMALAADDVDGMGECTQMLAEFNREGIIVERFVQAQGVSAAPPAGAVVGLLPGGLLLQTADPKEVEARLAPLFQIYGQLVNTVEVETPRLRRIFATPKAPLELLMQRVFDGKVWPLLQGLLHQPVPPDAWAEVHQAALRVLAGAHALTQRMVAGVAAAAGGLLDTEMSGTLDSVFGGVLESYPQAELDWLATLSSELDEDHQEQQREKRLRLEQALRPPGSGPSPAPSVAESVAPSMAGAAGASGGGTSDPLSVPLVAMLLAANAESVGRCVKLSPPSRLASAVRALFHGNGPFEPGGGALLEQLARHLLGGIEHAYDNGPGQDRPPPPPPPGGFPPPHPGMPPPPPTTKAGSARRSLRYITNTARKVFVAAGQASKMMADAQRHYATAVLPHVSSSLSELGACQGGLLTLVRAVEETLVLVLGRALDVFFATVERTLATEQRKEDFRAPAGGGPSAAAADGPGGFDQPTAACILVTSLLAALLGAAKELLRGANLASLLTEVGSRLHGALSAHMRRFTFSPHGALRWKNDLSEYTDAVRGFDDPAAVERLLGLQARVNVLIVAPDSLLGLVNGTLRLDHREALEYIRLREDFLSVRLEGRTLAQLFTVGPAAGEAAGKRRG